MSRQIIDVLTGRAFWIAARLLLTVVFALSGVAKLADFDGGLAEMARATYAFFFSLEHMSILGGLACAAVASACRTRLHDEKD